MSLIRLCTLFAVLSILSGSCVCYAQKITVDPNENQPAEPVENQFVDLRLAQTVTCEAWHAPLKTILADLSKSTGITLRAGYSVDDWQVRDRKMNICVKDVPLDQLMNSIARTMKFKWSINNDVIPPTYRLVADRRLLVKLQAEAARRQNALKAEGARRRAGLADALAQVADMPDSELESLKKSNPYLYYCGTTGIAKVMTQLLGEDPRIKTAFLNADKNALIQTETFSQATQQLCAKTLQLSEKYNSAKKLPADLDTLFNYEFDIGMMASPDEYSQQRQLTNFGKLAAYILRDDNGYHYIGSLKDPNAESTQLWASAMLASPDEKDSKWKTYDASFENQSAAQRTEEIGYYLMYDPVAQHGDEPELQRNVEMKITDEVKKPVEEQIKLYGSEAANRLWYQATLRLIADNAELNIVSDSYGVVLDGPKAMPFNGKLPELLSKVGETYLCNWEKHEGIVEVCRRDWFKRRSSQIPDEWLKPWREEIKKNEMLSMLSHAQMIILSDDQIDENIKTDHILSKVPGWTWDYNNQRGFLRLYVHLTDYQRKQIFTEDGLDPHTFNPDQRRYYSEMFNYGQRYAWNTEEFCDPDAGKVKITGKYDNTSPDGSLFYVVTVLQTKPDGTTNKTIWGITLHKVPMPKDEQTKSK